MAEYGVLAHIPGVATPQDDEAHFDGWYSTREQADEIFKVFVSDHPSALVHIVQRVHSKWQ